MNVALAVVALLSACGEPESPRPDDGARLALSAAPLRLPGVGDVEYTLTVRNRDDAVVWTRAITSSAYGDGAGAFSYVGTCDADATPNTVELVIDRILDTDGGVLDPASYHNPTPVTRSTPCVANTDTPVTFDITLARRADQGFFDVAVQFEEIFCSAKLDCQDAFLHDPNGDRGPTAVVAFACATSSGKPTYLYFADDVLLQCGAQSYFVDPTAGPGNLGGQAPAVFQSAVYRGQEDFPGIEKCYWNVAIGIDPTAAPCTISARATASSVPFDGHSPTDAIWPEILWDHVAIQGAAPGLDCGSNPLDGPGSLVQTTYTGFEGAIFRHQLTCATGEVTTAAVAACAIGGDPCDLGDPCAIGTCQADGSCLMTGQLADGTPCSLDGVCAPLDGCVSACAAGVCEGAQPSQPLAAATLPLSGAITDAADDSRAIAYLAEGADGVQALDTTNPDAPVARGAYTAAGLDCTEVAVYEDGANVYVAAACGAAGVKILDFTDPDAPTLLATLSQGTPATTLTLLGSWLYVGDGATVRVYDLSTPSSPVAGTSLTVATGGPVLFRLAAFGDRVYGLLDSGAVVAIDATTRSAPTLLYTWSGFANPTGFAAEHDVVYVTYDGAGFYILDFLGTHVTAPVVLYHDGGSQIVGLTLVGRYGLVVYADGRVVTLSLRLLSQPKVLTSSVATSTVTGLAILRQGVAFVAYGVDYQLLDYLPFLLATSPPEGSVGLYAADPLDLHFSEPLDPASIGALSVTVAGLLGGAWGGTVTQPYPDTLRWTQDVFFDPDVYAAIVGAVADLRGSPGPLVPDRLGFTVDTLAIAGLTAPLSILGGAPAHFTWSVPGATVDGARLLVSTDIQGTSPYYPYDEVLGVATPGGDGGFEAWWTPPVVTAETTFWAVVAVDIGGVTYYGQVVPITVSVNPDGCAGDTCPPAAGTILDEEPRTTLTGDIEGALEVGDLAYLAIGVGGLEIRDQTDPTSVTLVGSWVDASAGLDCRELVKRDDIVYLACGSAGVKLVNVADPAAPFLVGTVTVSGSATTLALFGHALYVGVGTRVAVYDISDPLVPVFIGWAGGASGVGPDLIVRVVVDGTVLYAFFADGTLIVFDLSVDVLVPVYVRVVAPLAGGLVATDFAVVDGLGYLGFLGGGLYIVDLRGVLVAGGYSWIVLWHDGGSLVLRVSVVGRRYAVLYDGGLVRIGTAAIPTAPWILSETAGTGSATGLALLSRWLFVGAGLELRVIDVPPFVIASSHRDGTRGACPDAPLDLFFSSPIDGATLSAATVDLDGGLAGTRTTTDAVVRFTPDAPFASGVHAVTVSQPDIRNVRGTYGPTRDYNASFEVADICGEWTSTPDAVLAGTSVQLAWDVSGVTPDAVYVHLATWPDPGDGFALTTSIAGVAAGGGAYTAVWDVPVGTTAPVWYAVAEVRVGTTSYWSPITRVDVGIALANGSSLPGDTIYAAVDSGPYAYLAVGAGLEIQDVSDPSHPIVLGRWVDPGGGTCQAVAVKGTTVYLACDTTGVHVIDVSDPAHPVRVYVINQPGAISLALYGDALYIGFGADIAIWNVTVATGPVYVRTVVTGAGVGLVRISIADGVLYVLYLDGTVRTWELFGVRFDPVFIRLIASLYPGYAGVDLVVLDGVAYIAYGGGIGLVAIDVRTLRDAGWTAVALWVQAPPAGASVVRISVRGGILAVVYSNGRLVIARLQGTALPVILSSTLRFGTPTAVTLFASGYVLAAYGATWSYVDPPLFLVASVPPDGGSTCGDGDIALLFSAPVHEESVHAKSLWIETGGSNVDGTWNVSGNLVTFVPAAPLADGSYSVHVADTLENERGTTAIASTTSFDVGAACVSITSEPVRVLSGSVAQVGWVVQGGSPTSERLLLSTSPTPASSPMATVTSASPASWTTPDVAAPTTWYAQVEAVVGGVAVLSRVVSFVVEPPLGGFTAGPGESILNVVEGESGLAYIAIGVGFAIRDVSDPDHPIELGRWLTGGTQTCDTVAVHGTTVYVSCGTDGVFIIDASDPLSLVYLGVIDIGAIVVGGVPVSLVIVGDALYIGLAGGDVLVFDIHVVGTPVYRTTIVGPGGGVGLIRLYLDGLTLYVGYSDGTVGVYGLIDLYAPAFVRLVTGFHVGIAVDITVVGGVAYVAYADGYVVILDVRGVPVLLGTIPPLSGGGAIVRISYRGGVLVVAYAGGALVTYSVVDPTSVFVVAQTWVVGVPTYVYIFRSGYAFWAIGTIVRFVDLPPVLVRAWPAGALVCASQSFAFRFSADIDPASITDEAIEVTQAGLPVDVTFSVTGDLVTVTPTAMLSGEVSFTVHTVTNLRGTVSTIAESRTLTVTPICIGSTAYAGSLMSGQQATFSFTASGGPTSNGEVVVGPLSAPRDLWEVVSAGASAPYSASWTAPDVAVPTVYGAYPRVTTADGLLGGAPISFTVYPEPCSVTPVCDDGNACTDDACTTYVGCVYTPNDANSCDDQSACTAGDHCQAGVCVPASTTTCTAATCEVASCNPGTGACETATAGNGTVCDDGDPGTALSACQDGACVEVAGGTFIGTVTIVPDPVYGTIIRRVVQVGIYAYAALEYGGLSIQDVSDPNNPVLVGGWSLGGGLDGCTDVAIEGNYAYLTCGSAFYVIDVSVVGSPVLVHTVDLSGATSVVVVDGHLYVTVGGVLHVYSIGAYGYPAYIGAYPVSYGGPIVRIWYDGGYLYTVDVNGVVRVLSLTAGNLPTLAWTFNTYSLIGGTWTVTDMVVIGGYLYVSYGGGGVYAFDVSSPNLPTLAWWSGYGDVTSIAYHNGIFVYGFASGAWITASVSDPANPVTLAWYPPPVGTIAVSTVQIFVSLSGVATAYIAQGSTASIADVPPFVVGMSPYPGTSGICAQGQVDLYFSSDIDPASVDATTVAVTQVADGSPVAGTFEVSARRVSFVPDAGALPAGDYHVRVTGGIRNVRGTDGAVEGFDADFGVAAACVQWLTAPSGIERGITGTFAWNVVGATADSGELLLSPEMDPRAPAATVETVAATVNGTGFTVDWTAPLLNQNTVYYAVPRVVVGGVTVDGPVLSFVVAYYGCYCAPGDHCESGVCVAQPVCDPGFDDCNGLYSDGCETNIANSDPLNCGGCYVACGGGVCTGATCEATVLVSGAGSGVIGIDVDDDHVYWGARASYQLSRAGKDGSNRELLVSGYYTNDVVVDDAWVYFTTYTNGTVHRAPKAGGAAELLAHGQPTPYAVALSGNDLYFASYASGDVRTLSLLDRSVATDVSGLPTSTGGLVVDGGTLFLTSTGGDVYTVPVGGGAATTLASPGSNLLTVDLDDRYVYFGGQTQLGRVRRDTGAIETFSTLGNPYAVAVDDRFIYWADYANGTINRLAKPIESDLGTNLICRAGHADCDDDGANDCEVDTERDRAHCGACGVTCGASEVCVAGVCGPLTCAPEYDDCDADVATGCEAYLRNDPAHCGSCGNACASGVCMGGDCVLEPARRSCLEHKNAGETTSGYYFVDPDDAGPAARVAVYCDQETDGGGWLVVARAADTNGYAGDYEFAAAAGDHSLLGTAHTTGQADQLQYSQALDTVWPFMAETVGLAYYCYDTTDPVATAYWAKVPAFDFAPLATALANANPDISLSGLTAVNADGVTVDTGRYDFFARGNSGASYCANGAAGQSGIKLACTVGQAPMNPAGVWMLTHYSGAYTEVTSCGHIGGNGLPFYAGEVRLREHACTDGFQNSEESDVDCGGPVCSACADGDTCLAASDCASLVCTGGVCQVPTCSDGVQNGDEVGRDCGGSCGADCAGITWQNPVNVNEVYTATGAGLDKIAGGTTWNAGASSVETLTGDGYVEFEATETTTHRMIGLGTGDTSVSYGDIEFAWYPYAGGGLQIYEAGTNRGNFGAYAPGDRFRVEVMNGQVRYAHNDVIIYSSGGAPVFPLRVDTSLYEEGATLRGAQLRDCTAQPSDPYCLFGRAWRNPVYVSGTATSLTRDPLSSGWNAGASSVTSFTCGQGAVTATATETTTDRVFGLSDGDTTPSYTDIDYGIWLRADGTVHVVEQGVDRGAFGSYGPGELYEVRMDAPTVGYYRNGVAFYTSTSFGTKLGTWVLDTALYSPGATLSGLALVDSSVPGDPECGDNGFWKNIQATVVGQSIGKLGGSASWDQGASSVPVIAAGDGFVEATAAHNTTYAMFGLSDADTTPSYTDIDFAIYTNANTWLYVYESGGQVTNFTQYAAGDRIRVEVHDGEVWYLRNGVHFYTSTRPPVYPLAADVALHSPGAAYDDVVLHTCGVDDPLCTAPIHWFNGKGVSATATSLYSDFASGWGGGASTRETLTCGDGYVEARIPKLSDLMLGLGVGDASVSYTDIEHAFYPTASGALNIYESGANLGSFGTYQADDVLRVEVAMTGPGAPYVRYLKNGTPLYTSTRIPTIIDDFRLDTSFNRIGDSLEDVVVHNADTGDGTCGGSAFWTDIAGAIVRDHSIRKDLNTNAYDAGAISQTTFTGDGYMEFTALENNTTRAAGLSNGNTDTSYADIDYAIYLAGSQVQVYERGTYRGAFGYYDPGARFRVEVHGDVVTYSKNGVVFYTSALAPTYPLGVDVSLYSPWSTLHDVAIAGCTDQTGACAPPLWQNGQNVTISDAGATLTRDTTAGSSWNGGASTIDYIKCGRGYVQATATETTTDRAFGLGFPDTTTSYSDIDYAFYLGPGGTLYVHESGTNLGVVGTYQTGDTLRIEVDAPVVRYLQNGLEVYVSADPANLIEDYHLDTALYTAGATLSGLTLVDLDAGDDGTCGAASFWTAASQAVVKGTGLRKDINTGSWDAGAISAASVDGDVYMAFTAPQAGDQIMAGLGVGNTDNGWPDVDRAVYLVSGNQYVGENSNTYGPFGTFPAGARFRVERVGGVVRYLRNGVAYYRSPLAAPTGPLVVDTSIVNQWAQLRDFELSTCDASCAPTIRWQNGRYLSAPVDSTGLVRDTYSNGSWIAGASSENVISCGRGRVRSVVNEITTDRMFGLGIGDASQSYTDIEYAFYLVANSALSIYESGSLVTNVGNYAPGDVLEVDIDVDAGKVSYWKNRPGTGGTPLWQSDVPAYLLDDLRLDVSLAHNAATLGGLQIIDDDAADPTCGGTALWQSDTSNTVLKGDSILKATGAAAGWNAGATTAASFTGDGFAEFVAYETGTLRAAGLGTDTAVTDVSQIDYGIQLNGTSVDVYENGVSRGNYYAFQSGDRFRVERVGDVVRYLHNGVGFYTSTIPSSGTTTLRGQVALYHADASIRAMTVQTCDGTCSPAVRWERRWGYLTAEQSDGSTLVRTAGSGWDTGAVSEEGIYCGQGYVESAVTSVAGRRMFGLGTVDSNRSYSDIEYATYLDGGVLEVYESGAQMAVVGTYQVGDVLRVELDGETVRYLKNGVVYYTSTRPANTVATYHLDTSFYEPTRMDGLTLVETGVGATDPTCGGSAFWKNATVTVKGQGLFREQTDTGWNRGASSIPQIALGQDGWVEFSPYGVSNSMMVGLGTDDTSAAYEDIDFALYLAGSALYVYESGANRGQVGTVAQGDRLRVEVTGGQVTYLRNGTVLYVSGVAPSGPLEVDTSFYDQGAAIQNVALVAIDLGACGDGVIDPWETCDDGGTASGDGCSSSCQIEAGYLCDGAPSSCVSAPVTTSCAQFLAYGTGRSGVYTIDPGAGAKTVYCDMEADGGGWTLALSTNQVDTPHNLATTLSDPDVNGWIALAGMRADRVRLDVDGTAGPASYVFPFQLLAKFFEDRTVSTGFYGQYIPFGRGERDTCGAFPQRQYLNIYGDLATYAHMWLINHTSGTANGILLYGDSYNMVCDGALGSVQRIRVWLKAPLCGDGQVEGTETCDDGNTSAGDGCSATCQLEYGWSCGGEPSMCAFTGTMRTCKELYAAGQTTSGVYQIDPDGIGGIDAFQVWCDQDTDGGGWTVFQKRFDGSVDFYQPWASYVAGFGSVFGEYWLGLERIGRFTELFGSELRIDMTHNGSPYFAKYGSFSEGTAANNYTLSLSGYVGTAGDSLLAHSGYRFSTYDSGATSCAQSYHGAWWYTSCHSSNLNGAWGSTSYGYGLNWYSLTGYYASVTVSEMKMRETAPVVFATSCKQLLDLGYTSSGVYTIDPDGAGGMAPLQTYCDQVTDGGGWTRVVNAVPVSLLDVRSTMDVIKAGQGSTGNDAENAWIGVDYWNAIGATYGEAEMRCWGGVTGTRTFRSAFAISEDANQTLTWAPAGGSCYGSYNSGWPLSSTDYDRDNWSSDCVDYAGDAWAWESHGWGWHQSCHCGGFWDGGNAADGPGGPLCFGMNETCWTTAGCRSDRVEFYVR
ncbi:MAG: DUF4215 domain-containing protein [Deltaproteobacteria bacterium]|nr:MAG: DUF4215 domain-containing protein [Deltaproteobacteria bacterium]